MAGEIEKFRADELEQAGIDEHALDARFFSMDSFTKASGRGPPPAR
jgi:hypothetical protein